MLLFTLPCLFLLVFSTPAPILRTPTVSQAPQKGRYFVSSAPNPTDLNDVKMRRSNYLDIISPQLFLKSFKNSGGAQGPATSPFNSPADYFAQRKYSAYSAPAAPQQSPVYTPSVMASPVPTVTYDATAYQQTLAAPVQPAAQQNYAAQAHQQVQANYAAQVQPQSTQAAQVQSAQQSYTAQAQQQVQANFAAQVAQAQSAQLNHGTPAQPAQVAQHQPLLQAVYNVVAQPQPVPASVAAPVAPAPAPVAAAPAPLVSQIVYARDPTPYPQVAPAAAPAPGPVYIRAPAVPAAPVPQQQFFFRPAAPAGPLPASFSPPVFAPRAMTVPLPTITVAAQPTVIPAAPAAVPVYNQIPAQSLPSPIYPSSIVVPPPPRPLYAAPAQPVAPSTPVYIQGDSSSPSKNPFQISYLPQTPAASPAQTVLPAVAAPVGTTLSMTLGRPALSYLQIQSGQQG